MTVSSLLWMRAKGIRFTPIYGRLAFKVNGKFKFWGGLTVEAWGGGTGLISGSVFGVIAGEHAVRSSSGS